MANILILGGGVAGLMCAWKLGAAGHNVSLYEAKTCGSGASGAGLGGLVPFPWSRNHALAQTQRASLEMYPALSDFIKQELGEDIGYNRCQRLQIAAHENHVKGFEQEIRFADGLAEFLPPEKLAKAEPQLAFSPFGALKCYQSACLNALKLTNSLKKLCLKYGVNIHENTSLTIENAQKMADIVIVATGAWTHQLLPHHERAKITPVRGQALRLRTEKPLLKHIVKQEDLYIIPHQNEYLIGATTQDDGSFNTEPCDKATKYLIYKAKNLVPDLHHAELVNTWVGLRPRGPKGETAENTLIRQIDSNLYLATGHYKLGFCLAPAVGERAVQLMQDFL